MMKSFANRGPVSDSRMPPSFLNSIVLAVVCLAIFITQAATYEWTLVELETQPGTLQVIDFSVSGGEVLVLARQLQTQGPIPSFAEIRIASNGKTTQGVVDIAGAFPRDATSTSPGTNLIGVTKVGLVGVGVRITPPNPNAEFMPVLGSEKNPSWLPLPNVNSAASDLGEVRLTSTRARRSHPDGWITGEWELQTTVRERHDHFKTPVVWIPNESGQYSVVPLWSDIREGSYRYPGLTLSDVAPGLVAGSYAPQRPDWTIPIVATLVSSTPNTKQSFRISELAMLAENNQTTYGMGAAVHIVGDRVFGWVAKRSDSDHRIPAIWALSMTTDNFNSKLTIVEKSAGEAVAASPQCVYVNAFKRVIAAYGDGKREDLKVQNQTFSIIHKHREGVAIARVRDSSRLVAIRLPEIAVGAKP